MKKWVVLFMIVLFIICLGTFISERIKNSQTQGTDFVETEKNYWDSQEKTNCNMKQFGFASGDGSFKDHIWGIFHVQREFNWVAFAEEEEFVIFKFNRILPHQILKSLSELEEKFQSVIENGRTVIWTSDSWFVANPPIWPYDVLRDKINLILKTGMNFKLLNYEVKTR